MKIRALVLVACMPLAACAVLFEDVSGDKKPDADKLQSAWDSGAPSKDATWVSPPVVDAGAARAVADAEATVADAGLRPWGEEPGYVFVTAAVVDGRLGVAPNLNSTGVGAGDALCEREARANPELHGRRFAAYLSDDGKDARNRPFFNSRGWMQVDGTPVAPATPLVWMQGDVTGALASVTRTATGQIIMGDDVWTGARADGTAQFACDHWTADTSLSRGSYLEGAAGVVPGSVEWGYSCRERKRVLCIEVAR